MGVEHPIGCGCEVCLAQLELLEEPWREEADPDRELLESSGDWIDEFLDDEE